MSGAAARSRSTFRARRSVAPSSWKTNSRRRHPALRPARSGPPRRAPAPPAPGMRRTPQRPSPWSRRPPRRAPGSIPSRSSATGIRIPASPATSRLITIAAAITAPRTGEPNQTSPTIPITTAKIAPLIRPTPASRVTTRIRLALVRSFVASARTATVSDWVPALPPIEATIGISTASATTCAIASSNCAITSEARIAVIRFTKSQGSRCFVVSPTRSDRLDSSPTPARRRMSSSCTSSSTFIASSMVMTPTSRPSSSTTGAEIR
jgi:hypothetical protein